MRAGNEEVLSDIGIVWQLRVIIIWIRHSDKLTNGQTSCDEPAQWRIPAGQAN